MAKAIPNLEVKHFTICEWIARIFLPNLHTNLNAQGYSSLYDFLHDLNLVKMHHNASLELTKRHFLNSLTNCSIINDLTQDFTSNLKFCYKIESNLYYFGWLLSLFTPLLYCLLSLFVLPALIVIFLYASSLFMFITKHWTKLKVSNFSCLIFIFFFFFNWINF